MAYECGERFDRYCLLCHEETEYRREGNGRDRCMTCFGVHPAAEIPPDSRGCTVFLLVILLIGGAAARLMPW